MNKKPKILFYDIETSPNLGYVWEKYEQNVLSYTKEWELLSFAWKWQGEKTVNCLGRIDFKDKTEKSLVKSLWNVLNEADIVIGHNSDEFDNKKARAKFVEHSLSPPTPYKTIDTKKVAKSNFKFNSNSLNDLGKTLKLGEKVHTGGFDLWLDCMAGKKSAWAKMKKYNKQDVLLLEKVYDKLKVWDTKHIDLSAMAEKPGNCPLCASPNLHKRGFNYTRSSMRAKMRCVDCGHWSFGPIKRIKP